MSESRDQDAQKITTDALFDGRLICQQHRHGYRFSVDAVLLAHFCPVRPGDRILDLGCGSGIIGLILCSLHQDIALTGLEIQAGLAGLAQKNIQANQWADRMNIVQGDARQPGRFLAAESFDLVVCNPPYRAAGSGRINRTDEAAVARHELKATLDDMVSAAFFAVKNRGPVCFVYPAKGLSRLLTALELKNCAVKRVQPVYSSTSSGQASLVLVEARKNGGPGCLLAAPFYVYDGPDRAYSPAMRNLYKGAGRALSGLDPGQDTDTKTE
jgi:tRNA1Val (adenine37-N6)-methyltransferase